MTMRHRKTSWYTIRQQPDLIDCKVMDKIPYFFNELPHVQLLFCVVACFSAPTNRGRCLLLWEAHWHQQRLDKVHTSHTATTVWTLSVVCTVSQSRFQVWRWVIHNNSSSSLVTVVRNHLHAGACAMYDSRGYYSKVDFFYSLRAFDCADTI